MEFLVRFWGTRGSIPTPGHATKRFGGNTSCVELLIDGVLMICDGGSGLRELGLRLTEHKGAPVEAHMFFSHMHWDHIQGFPFFIPAYSEKSRLHVYEVAKDRKHIKEMLHGQMSSDYFPVRFSDLGAQILSGNLEHGTTRIDGVTVRSFEQNHPGRSYAYSFEKNGKKFVYATDNELDLTLLNREASLADPAIPRLVPSAFIDFIANADLLVADGQYTDEEYPTKSGWGHARANTVVDAAALANVKQCAIYHHDPMHSDSVVDAIITRAQKRAQALGSAVTVFGAREGMTLKL
jgi:phosphoribosyl 1,2-cyclic phosphodiesterase